MDLAIIALLVYANASYGETFKKGRKLVVGFFVGERLGGFFVFLSCGVFACKKLCLICIQM